MNLRKYAKGKPCMVRLPGCTFDTESTVLCHVRLSGTGIGRKEPDALAVWACQHCHDLYDNRKSLKGWSREEIRIAFYEGVFRTQQELIKDGILKW